MRIKFNGGLGATQKSNRDEIDKMTETDKLGWARLLLDFRNDLMCLDNADVCLLAKDLIDLVRQNNLIGGRPNLQRETAIFFVDKKQIDLIWIYFKDNKVEI